MKKTVLLITLSLYIYASDIKLHILGSGGPELQNRASSSYLITIDGKAKILVDVGSSSIINFSKAGGAIEDLEAILITHTHIDHVNDLSAYVKAGYFSQRTEDLPIFGPPGSSMMPSIKEYLLRLFGENGAYAYMQDVLNSKSDSFTLVPIVLPLCKKSIKISPDILMTSIGVNHGVIPTIAYRVEIDDKIFVFSGDTTAKSENLTKLAKNADFFIADFAIAEFGYNIAAKLHMRPSRIAKIAKAANVKHLILSHLMRRSLNAKAQSLRIIKNIYKGKVSVAQDNARFYKDPTDYLVVQ